MPRILRRPPRAPKAPEPFRYLHELRIAAIDVALDTLDAKERINPLDIRIPRERARFTRERRMLAGEAWLQEWWHAVGAAESVAQQTMQREMIDHRIPDAGLTAEQIAAARKRLGLDD